MAERLCRQAAPGRAAKLLQGFPGFHFHLFLEPLCFLYAFVKLLTTKTQLFAAFNMHYVCSSTIWKTESCKLHWIEAWTLVSAGNQFSVSELTWRPPALWSICWPSFVSLFSLPNMFTLLYVHTDCGICSMSLDRPFFKIEVAAKNKFPNC